MGQRALITGASSGIGRAYAERLARDGYDLVVVARRRQRLEELAQRLTETTRASVEVVAADLTERPVLDGLIARLSQDGVDLLVNSAGFAGYMPFVRLPEGRARELIDLHVVAATLLTRAVLPAMLARGQGAVINVASLLAFAGSLPASPMPPRAVYAGAKAYLVAFTETLASELKETPVRLQVCCPGIVRTEFHDQAGMDPSRLGTRMEPDEVVAASLQALALGEVICVPGLEDPGAISAYREASRRLLQLGNVPTLASRYRQRAE
ncbi:MAG TPA: SDR family oxidoreductase [Candidatus Limnocylindrales bacterium]|nr:SDR family oxidoreductase [Candidatus Limnocylindrales bacterium]